MHTKSLMLAMALTMKTGTTGVLTIPAQSRAVAEQRADVRELLGAARGVAPMLCALAADGASNGWGGSWDAPDVSIRSDVHQLMRSMRNASLAPAEAQALLDGLASDDACVRHLSGTLIGRSGDRGFVPELVTRLRATAPYERGGAIRALGMLEEKSAVDAIVRALRDEQAAVRANAAWALGRIGEKRAASAVANTTGDESANVRGAAVVSLGQLESADNVDVLLRVLERDSDASVRRSAAWALGQIDAPSATKGLATAMRGDKSPAVREMSAWAIGEMEARDAGDALVATLKGDDAVEVRETAAWALGEMELKKAVDALAESVASDKEARVRGTAAWAIGQMNPGRAPRALIAALRDGDDDVRLKSAWALSQIGDADVVSDVATALRGEQRDRVRQALVRALLESGDRSSDVFKDLLESKDKETREMAVRALAGRRGPWPWPWPWPRPRPFP